MSAQNWLTVKNRLSENLVWSKFRSDLSFLIIIWRLTFKNDAFSLNSTEFTRWAYPSNCIWFTCDHDRYVWLNQIKNSLYLAWIPGKFVFFSEKLYLWSRWICLCFKSFLKRNRSCHFVIIWTLVGRFDFFRVLRVHRIVILFVLEIILSYVFQNMFYLEAGRRFSIKCWAISFVIVALKLFDYTLPVTASGSIVTRESLNLRIVKRIDASRDCFHVLIGFLGWVD